MMLADSMCRYLYTYRFICRYSVPISCRYQASIMPLCVGIVGMCRYKKYGKVLPALTLTHTYNTQKYLVMFYKYF